MGLTQEVAHYVAKTRYRDIPSEVIRAARGFVLELEALGYDQVRSRIRIKLKSGKMIEGRYDVARGHPQKPMSWAELGDKFRDCADLVLPRKNAEAAIQLISRLEELRSLKPLLRALSGVKENGDRKTKAVKPGSKKWSRTLKR